MKQAVEEVVIYEDVLEVMDSKESAAFLRISYNDFLIKCREGQIPHFTMSDGPRKQRTPIFCRRSTLEEWIAEKERASIKKQPIKLIRRLK